MSVQEKRFFFKFGSGQASTNTGLSPTLTIFSAQGLTALTAPGVTETPAGSGLYHFGYSIGTVQIVFEIDGGAALATSDRYLYGALDPQQYVDQQVGTGDDSFGSTSVDPTTMYGLVKRLQEFMEGDATYTKSTGVWAVSSRGSSTLLASKTLTNDTTSATKS